MFITDTKNPKCPKGHKLIKSKKRYICPKCGKCYQEPTPWGDVSWNPAPKGYFLVESGYDKKELMEIAKGYKSRGRKTRISVHNKYTWPTYSLYVKRYEEY